ncbi:hypothetical protein F0562_026404 [Nyssa sinensis]|uniref:Uncharacterized protein n=1 Tax=Nyssa sinensis TaxID=561372 RepID=A0A5J5BCU0_9ASTE|nr:hypothetical protein F0562_026404 [Nyssa sinensis]
MLRNFTTFQSLAECYVQVTGELRKDVSSVLQMQSSGISDSSDPASPLLTRDKKLFLHQSGQTAAQLESAQCDIKLLEVDLEIKKRQVPELQKQVAAALETKVSDSNCKIAILVEELEIIREKLDVSEEDIVKLKDGLSNEIFEGTHQLLVQLELAQEDIVMLEAKLDSEKRQMPIVDANSRDNQIQQLEVHLHQIHMEQLFAGSSSCPEARDELRLEVGELEKEVGRQRVVASERAEEKREGYAAAIFLARALQE